MNKLEAVVEKCASVTEFLADKNLIESYFHALQSTFGEAAVDRSCYYKILGQLEALIKNVPGFEEKIWLKTDNKAFDFEIETWRAEGRGVDASHWADYMGEWRRRLHEKFKPWFSVDESQNFSPATCKKIARILSRAEKQMKAIERSQSDDWQRKVSFREFRLTKEFKAVASLFLFRHLNSLTFAHRRLICGEGDVVLDQLRAFKNDPLHEVVPTEFRASAGGVLTHIKYLVPPLRKFLSREDLFPIQKSEQRLAASSSKSFRYVFKTVNRRFHAIWAGMPTGDCLAGAPGTIDSITELRWALSALDGSYIQHVYNEWKYLGHIRLTTIHDKNGADSRRRVVSLEIHCPVAIKKVIARADKSGKILAPLFIVWLHEAMKRRSAIGGVEGFAVGTTGLTDNAKVLPSVRRSPAFTYGRSLGHAENYEASDELAKLIPNRASREGLALKYPAKMLFDASVCEGALTLLADALNTKQWSRHAVAHHGEIQI